MPILFLLVPCELVLVLEWAGPWEWPSSWRSAEALKLCLLAVAVGVPALLAYLAAWRLGRASGRSGFRLMPDPVACQDVKDALETTWDYERDRYRQGLTRARFYATTFGCVASLLLTAAALLLRWWGGDARHVADVAYAVAAATATAFALNFARVVVRLSNHDVSANAFSWSTRSLVLVAIAAGGLVLALRPEAGTNVFLLGVFIGVTGEHAIDFLVEKAPKSLGVSTPAAPGPSPLLALDGVRQEHVDRLEEEGIVSLHDLALIPTPRLFFNTPYGLPIVCDWQDQALLCVRVGQDRARDLSNQLGIRGVTALRRMAEELLPRPCSPGEPASAGHSAGSASAAAEALQRALRLDKDAPLHPLLENIRDDEAAARLQAFCRSVVMKPAGFVDPDDELPAPSGAEVRLTPQRAS